MEKVCCVKQKKQLQSMICTVGRYTVKDEALIGSIPRHVVDLVFPSKPWAPNVHLVSVELVTNENLGGRGRERGGGEPSSIVNLRMGGGGRFWRAGV